MNFHDILAWAQRHSYPALVISSRERILAGSTSWHYFLSYASAEELERLVARIAVWNEYEQEVQAS